MDWDLLEQRKVRPPFKPRVVSFDKHRINQKDFFINKKNLSLKSFREAHVMPLISTRNLLARSRC